MSMIYKNDDAVSLMVSWFDRFRSRLTVETETRRVSTKFGETHVLIGGPEDGPALVLLHGQLSTSAHVLVEMAPLLERYRVYAVDIVGQSVMGSLEMLSVSNNDYGEWLAEVFDGLGLSKAFVIGVSFGGYVAQRLAVAAPERIERLVLIVPAGVVKSHWSGWYKIGIPMTLYLMSPSPERLKAFLKHLMTTSDEHWEGYMGDVFQSINPSRAKIPRLARPGEFARLDAPTLVLGGDQDLSFPGGQVIERLEKLIPNVETELMENCRHCPPTTDEFRRWLARRVSQFLMAS
jgi:2-hydroxy-6-oxonona-2,4-dienedioate hydrolase